MSTRAAAPPDLLPPVPAEARVPGPWVQAFVVFLLLCQLALLSGDVGPLRVLVRAAAFGASLMLLVLLRGRGGTHPAALPAVLVVVVLGIAVFNPDTTQFAAGAAHAALYTAVLAPVFWVPRLRVDVRVIRQVAMILWAFHTLSAFVGVLQVYFPGQFQPNLSSIVASKGQGYLESLMITTIGGVKVFRPMGLTDIPGGASISGLYAVLFGTGFFLTRRNPWMMAAATGSMALGMMCLYLSQVRAVLVMTAIAVLVVAGILVWRRDAGRLTTLVVAVAVVVVGGYAAATAIAGPMVGRRVASLVRDRPGAVYYSERGHFFDDALIRLRAAPLGSGLGHWGMMAAYFGKGEDPARSVWVEIQWVGWIVDGGVPLVLLYLLALLVALYAAWNVARAPPPPGAEELPFWGAIVLAHGIGALALTFSYPIFVSQPGMEFWLLNAALCAAARHARQRARALRAAQGAERAAEEAAPVAPVAVESWRRPVPGIPRP
ncbi:MAG TPA: hypothetical protein VEW03_15085 [Longimicrobiaceae bacterium]|nr:hypothetical protein [Longimicrobiaceae bacterium]